MKVVADGKIFERVKGESLYPGQFEGEWPNDCVMVVADNVMQYMPDHVAAKAIAEWAKSLRPGGTLTIEVPDARRAMVASLNGESIDLETTLMGSHREFDDRKSIWDEAGLRKKMYDAGFEDVRRLPSPPMVLTLEGRKPDERTIEGVWCAQTFPRYGSTLHFGASLDALNSLGIKAVNRWGTFWEACLTGAIEKAIEQGCRYILTLDFDTLYTAATIRSLYRLAEANPNADAIFALQIKRDTNHPLFFIREPDGKTKKSFTKQELDGDLLKVDAGHFGCSIFRAEAFVALDKPWMHSQPGPDGRWEEGRIDADISFWANWKDNGNSAYVAPRVPVGHIQEVVTWPDRDFNIVHQYVSDWRTCGMPENVKR